QTTVYVDFHSAVDRSLISEQHFAGTLTVPHSHEHGHLKIYLPKKLLECLPKCTSLPKERHRWNTNEVRTPLLIVGWNRQGSSDQKPQQMKLTLISDGLSVTP
uniref:Calmodulin binding transcription activator 1 n=1 Tax=Acanthochromis polyacanthus TaxID=80966 RepID=A0A3Q1HB49_9TELE